jgi:hypothetical protein
VIGVGRGGATLAPVVAGFLFVAGATLPTVAAVMGAGSLLGAMLLWLLRYSEPSQDAPAASSSSDSGSTSSGPGVPATEEDAPST